MGQTPPRARPCHPGCLPGARQLSLGHRNGPPFGSVSQYLLFCSGCSLVLAAPRRQRRKHHHSCGINLLWQFPAWARERRPSLFPDGTPRRGVAGDGWFWELPPAAKWGPFTSGERGQVTAIAGPGPREMKQETPARGTALTPPTTSIWSYCTPGEPSLASRTIDSLGPPDRAPGRCCLWLLTNEESETGGHKTNCPWSPDFPVSFPRGKLPPQITNSASPSPSLPEARIRS